MYGVRSFGSVPTCSGCGFSNMGRFRPLRMMIRGRVGFTDMAVECGCASFFLMK